VSLRRQGLARSLTDDEKRWLSPYIAAVDLDNAVLHDGHVPWYLHRRFVAVVRGNHIYMRLEKYTPGTPQGLALLGHELTHVMQYRNGMTVLAYLCASLRGYARNPYERAAFAVQAQILDDLSHRPLV
jgi:hypothetical protein